MTIKKNALIFLLGAVFLFAGIVLKQYGVSKTSTYPDKKQYLESVLQNVNGALKNSENHARQILSKLEQGKGVIYFDILKTRQPFPLFIHQADSLVFWSDYQYSIPEKILKEDKKYDFLDIDAGKFIILRINGENNLKVSVLLPLFRDYQIQNQFLEPNHNEDFFKNENLKVFKGEESDAFTISTKGGKYLFSISFIQDEISNPRIVGLSFICIVLFIVLSVISLYQFNNHAGKLNKGVLVFITISGIITLRLILLYFSFPEAWLDMELFNPEHYASSVLNASLGDLLLNILTALVCAVILLNNYQNKTFIQRITGLRSISIPVIILLNVALFFVFADAMYSLYRHSLHSFDITDNISLNQFKLWYLIIFCLFSAGYFILNHILVRLFVLLSDNKKRVYIISLILFVLAGLLLNILYELPFYLFLLHAVFVTVVLFFRLYNTLRAYSYRAYIYFITCAVFTAFSASFLVMENRTEMDYQKKIC